VHASYLHTHWASTPEVAARLVAAADPAGGAAWSYAEREPSAAGERVRVSDG
jgi:hypothetical protein